MTCVLIEIVSREMACADNTTHMHPYTHTHTHTHTHTGANTYTTISQQVVV
jgi:hypothetical protein